MPTEEMFVWFEGLCKELEKLGISFYDCNSGNVMKRGGEHVIIDLGTSTVKSAPKVPDDLLIKYADELDETAAAIEAMLAPQLERLEDR